MRWLASRIVETFRVLHRRTVVPVPSRGKHLVSRAYMWIYALYYSIGIILTYVGVFSHERTSFTFWAAVRLVVFVAVYIWVVAVDRAHTAGLCETCAVEFPINPGAQAERYSRSLRLTHWQVEHRLASLGIVVLFVLSAFLPWPFDSAMFGLFVWLGLFLGVAHYRHDALQLWCPYCPRGRGDDDPETAPTPVPAPTGSVPA